MSDATATPPAPEERLQSLCDRLEGICERLEMLLDAKEAEGTGAAAPAAPAPPTRHATMLQLLRGGKTGMMQP